MSEELTVDGITVWRNPKFDLTPSGYRLKLTEPFPKFEVLSASCDEPCGICGGDCVGGIACESGDGV